MINVTVHTRPDRRINIRVVRNGWRPFGVFEFESDESDISIYFDKTTQIDVAIRKLRELREQLSHAQIKAVTDE